jgi:SAM-dependent methyltransferase
LSLVKTEFDFGWKKDISPLIMMIGNIILKSNSKAVLDIGCGTCQLANYLFRKNWRGKYYGIELRVYENYSYPQDIKLIIPKVDMVIMSNILEHVNDPVDLIKKAFTAADHILINVPKRNEEMWRLDIVEYHQLDKSHKHCGFNLEEIKGIIELGGGKIITYKEHGEVNAFLVSRFFKNKLIKKVINLLAMVSSTNVFYTEIFCKVEKRCHE